MRKHASRLLKKKKEDRFGRDRWRVTLAALGALVCFVDQTILEPYLCVMHELVRYVMLCYVMLCYVMLCYVMLCYVMLCYVMLCYVMLCYVIILLCASGY